MARKQRSSIEENLNKIYKDFTKIGKIEPTFIALICWVIIVIGSLIHERHELPESYFSDKRNIFNRLFAKWSFAWSLAFVTPYIVLTSLMKSRNNLKVVSKNVARLVVAFVVWYSVTSILDWIENLTGDCEGSDLYSRKNECIREGLLWRGFDISGHSFLLTYCMLIISEEIQVVNLWTNEKVGTQWKREFVICCYVSNVFYTCCCLLMMLWVMLLIFTAVYFHTTQTKVIGIGIGVSSWILTYQIYFPSQYFPGIVIGF